ncbi:hypothetical protein Zmor_003524 [Zophobas morio]|uniref:Neuropeptide F n=2 Tax=Zophobas TaxID=7073 RepID=A0AA38HMC8_9CUCU|nr:hypothetical protein Zmor_003524 [Zophobas morio]UXO98087.1 neuropeptide F1 transcript a [Zophobas atratus]
MRWSALWWFAVIAAMVMLEANAAPSPRNDNMLQELLKLDQLYSSVARPRFGKRVETNSNFAPIEYEGQYQSEDVGDWLPLRR